MHLPECLTTLRTKELTPPSKFVEVIWSGVGERKDAIGQRLHLNNSTVLITFHKRMWILRSSMEFLISLGGVCATVLEEAEEVPT